MSDFRKGARQVFPPKADDLMAPRPIAAVVPMPASRSTLQHAIAAYGGEDLVLLGRLNNVQAAIGDFLRVLHELPDPLPEPLREAVDGVLKRL